MGDTVDLGPYETVGYSRTFLDTVVCDSMISPNSKFTWKNSGTYYDTLMNLHGFDSLININLTVNYHTNFSLMITVCDSMVSPSGKYTWITSGTYIDTIPNMSGCDSIITVTLKVNYSTNSAISITVCDSIKSPSGRYTWVTSDIYLDTIKTISGCDSIIAINLTVKYSSDTTLTLIVCDSMISYSGKYIWKNSGSYKDTIPNYNGCDSIITVNLTVKYSSDTTLTLIACDNSQSPSGKYTWKNSGTYYDTLINSNGCDSIITIHLTVNFSSDSTYSLIVCDSMQSPSGKYIWKTSGTYYDTIPNFNGCDSIMTFNLTVNHSNSSTLTTFVCDSLQSPSGKYIWITSGTYYDTLVNSTGCDSIITVNLTVNYSTSSTLTIAVCDSMQSPSGNYIWTTSGIYYDTIPNTNGCDSLMTFNLIVNYSTIASITTTVCDSLLSPSGKYVWKISGTYYDTLVNSNGCDSLMTIDLTINYPSSATYNFSVCENLISPSGRFNWLKTGTYSDTIPNYNGCDSIIIVNLTIDSADLTLTNNSNTITSNQNGATYQWLDCANDSIILGETSQNYSPSINGSYAVILNYLSCIDTSACININNVGIQKNTLNADVKIYPNPTSGIFILDFGNSKASFNIMIVDVLGKIIMEFDNKKAQEKIDLSAYANGVYFINIANEMGNKTIKLIKE